MITPHTRQRDGSGQIIITTHDSTATRKLLHHFPKTFKANEHGIEGYGGTYKKAKARGAANS